MRNLRSNLVVVEIEVPADVRPGPEISQRTTALSLEDALQGSRMARFACRRDLHPHPIDEGHQYIVRIWHGPDATSRTLKSPMVIVGSIRSDSA